MPMEERIKNDLNFVVSKYAEAFVNSDSLRRQLLLEELSKFKEITAQTLENKMLTNTLKQRSQELQLLQKQHDRKLEKYTKEIRNLKKEIEEEKREKLKMMEHMVRLLEREKTTRERIFGYMENDDSDDETRGRRDKEEPLTKDRLAQFFDDVRLLEAGAYLQSEAHGKDDLRR